MSHNQCHSKKDYFFWGMLCLSTLLYIGSFFHLNNPQWLWFNTITHHFAQLMNTVSWGVGMGLVAIALLGTIPRHFILKVLGTGTGLTGILRATLGGVLLDLCSHGILLIAAKLYERGASIGQVIAFLLASPWNSLSLTFILISLIGLKWTLIYLGLSFVIGIITGLLFDGLVKLNVLPKNPATTQLSDEPTQSFKKWLSSIHWSFKGLLAIIKQTFHEAKMLLRWLLLGLILAALIKTFVNTEVLSSYFGPTLLGLGATMIAAIIIEICSEGSSPIAADLFNRAKAPGNAFAFLMGGVSTDATELMIIKEATKSWKIALYIPLLSLPQIIILGIILNHVAL